MCTSTDKTLTTPQIKHTEREHHLSDNTLFMIGDFTCNKFDAFKLTIIYVFTQTQT